MRSDFQTVIFLFEFRTMFAQAGIDSTSPNSVPPTDAASNAIWWLIPLSIACLGLIWYLRRLNNSTLQASGRNESQKSSSTKARLVVANEADTLSANGPERQIHSSKSSSKKKKKAQANNQRNAKKQKEKQGDSSVLAKSVAAPKFSSEQMTTTATWEEKAIDAKSPAVAQTPSQTPIPVAAIFEPLRSIAPPRRKVPSFETQPEDLKSKSISEESAHRPPSGGKFERMVPSTAYTRAAASRWPASMTNPVERAVATRPNETKPEPKSASTVTSVSATELPQSTVPAAKGLKSFVSKLKIASAADSDSVGTKAKELTEQ